MLRNRDAFLEVRRQFRCDALQLVVPIARARSHFGQGGLYGRLERKVIRLSLDSMDARTLEENNRN